MEENCTHIEEPSGYAVPRAQLFKGVWLIFLFQKNTHQDLLSKIKRIQILQLTERFSLVQSQSGARTDHQHHNLQPTKKEVYRVVFRHPQNKETE